MKPKVTLRLFSAFNERNLVYCLKQILKFRMQTVFQINILPSFDVMY